MALITGASLRIGFCGAFTTFSAFAYGVLPIGMKAVWALSGQPPAEQLSLVFAVPLGMRIHNCHVTIQKTLRT
jgi:fluoride ion exporter CrcB/FEX